MFQQSCYLQYPRQAGARALLPFSASQDSILGQPQTIKSLFRNPFNQCLFLFASLKEAEDPVERDSYIDQIMITGIKEEIIAENLAPAGSPLKTYIIKAGANVKDSIQRHLDEFGPGPKIVILTKPIDYHDMVDSVNLITADT